jgi:hypothetical protein
MAADFSAGIDDALPTWPEAVTFDTFGGGIDDWLRFDDGF